MKASEILENKNDQIIMHTPVITGRTDSINGNFKLNIIQTRQLIFNKYNRTTIRDRNL